MKRVLKVLGLLVLALVLGVVGIVVVTFSGNGEVHDGSELGVARTVKDGYVSLFMLDAGGGKVVLIDAGNDPAATAILAELARRKLGPDAVQAIFLTHGHRDHIAGCAQFPNAQIYALEPDVRLAEGKIGSRGPLPRLMGPNRSPVKISHGIEDGEIVKVGELAVQAFAVPGHTAGSAAYLAGGALYLGDSADADDKGKVHGAKWLFSDDQAQNRASLKALVRRLPTVGPPIKWLAFAHSGTLDGVQPLVEFTSGL